MESQLEVITEIAQNIEHTTHRTSTTKLINDAIKVLARKEGITRAMTLTFKIGQIITGEKVVEIIKNNFVSLLPIQHWQDKEFVYVRFSEKTDLENIVSMLRQENNEPLSGIGRIMLKNDEGEARQLVRRPVKLEVAMVRESVKIEEIRRAFEQLSMGTIKFSDVKEGKLIQASKSRYISIKANAPAVELLYLNLDGIIVMDKTRLYPRINAKPYTCRSCYSLQPMHQCPGKACANCGSQAHNAKDCNTKKRFCNNCKKPGHRAKDSQCQRYVQEVVKEIQKMDIPLEFLSDSHYRAVLIKNLNY